MICLGGFKTRAKEFSTFINNGETSPVTAGDHTYYVYRYKGKINDIENRYPVLLK